MFAQVAVIRIDPLSARFVTDGLVATVAPPIVTFPVVVIVSMYESLKYKEEVPKSTSESVIGESAPLDKLICSLRCG
jgi:hypothetical protein